MHSGAKNGTLVACLGTSNPYIQIIKPISAMLFWGGDMMLVFGVKNMNVLMSTIIKRSPKI